MTIRRAFFILLILIAAHSAAAQRAAALPAPAPFAQTFINVSGRLDNATPRAVYPFDGLRGDVITVRLTVTEGDLDPILTILDSRGAILATRDDIPGGGRSLTIDSLRVASSDRYSVIVSRFGDSLGVTSGGYTLTVERIGVSSQSGSALRYGDSVYNEISDAQPIIYYSFRADAGDVITVRMQHATGDLDAALQILNSRAEVVGENDDVLGSLDAAITGVILRESGVYVIVATRYGRESGRSRGAFVLTLDAGTESGLGSRTDFPIPITPGTPLTGSLSNQYYERFYAFEGRSGQVVSIRMSRTGGALDTYLALVAPDGREVITDDDGGGGQNSLIGEFTLPQDGTYLIIATRFERDAGTTTGDYTLQLSIAR